MMKERKEVFKTVMHIGEDPAHFRGGIGAVLSIYKKYFPAFRSIGTHRNISGIGKIIYFGLNYIYFNWVLLSNQKIRIIHIHGSYGASVIRKSIIAYTAKKIFGKKVIYHIHSSEYNLKYATGSGLYKRLCNYLLHQSDRVGCLTPGWNDLFSREFNITNGIVMINMINPPEFKLEEKKIHQPDKPIRFIFLGLIDEKKGVFDLVKMVAENRQALEGKVVFHIGGIGKIAELKAMISHYHLHDIIDYRGWIGETEKEKLFREADAFILPSYNEGMPVCILEAMSFGLPILATRVGGIPEIMEHGVNGYLFNKADKSAMLQAIMCYVNDPLKLQEQGQHSYQLVQRFFPQQVIPLMEDIYRSLLS